jgi:hypothetical protein
MGVGLIYASFHILVGSDLSTPLTSLALFFSTMLTQCVTSYFLHLGFFMDTNYCNVTRALKVSLRDRYSLSQYNGLSRKFHKIHLSLWKTPQVKMNLLSDTIVMFPTRSDWNIEFLLSFMCFLVVVFCQTLC